MSDYLLDYISRINASGNTIGESQFNSTANYIESSFSDSPFYHIAKWNGTDLELRLIDVPPLLRGGNQPQQYGVKFAQFKPNVVMNLGEIIGINNMNWIIVDFTSENKLFPKAKIELCNSSYHIKTNKTRVLKGYNQLSKPVYDDVYAVDRLEPCIVETGTVNTDTNAQLVIPKNSILITMKYQLSDTLNYNDEFTMYNNKYKISDIDYTKVINEKGIIKIIAERV